MPETKRATNVRTGQEVVMTVATPDEAHVEALEAERDAYASVGKTDRAKEVDAEIKRYKAFLAKKDKEEPEPEEETEADEEPAEEEPPAVTATAAPGEKRGPARPRKYAKDQ